jgi:hypothetical protein
VIEPRVSWSADEVVAQTIHGVFERLGDGRKSIATVPQGLCQRINSITATHLQIRTRMQERVAEVS